MGLLFFFLLVSICLLGHGVPIQPIKLLQKPDRYLEETVSSVVGRTVHVDASQPRVQDPTKGVNGEGRENAGWSRSGRNTVFGSGPIRKGYGDRMSPAAHPNPHRRRRPSSDNNPHHHASAHGTADGPCTYNHPLSIPITFLVS